MAKKAPINNQLFIFIFFISFLFFYEGNFEQQPIACIIRFTASTGFLFFRILFLRDRRPGWEGVEFIGRRRRFLKRLAFSRRGARMTRVGFRSRDLPFNPN
ncbi:MAG: hypothetical protein ACOYNN_13110 [Terrimicrobiaceae bacterium]